MIINYSVMNEDFTALLILIAIKNPLEIKVSS